MFKKTLLVLVLALVLLTPMFALAQAFPDSGMGPNLGLVYGVATGLARDDIRLVVARIISTALGVLGILATVLVIYAGFRWMTAGGNEEQAGEARKILYAAVIGLVIILSAYSITKFVATSLFSATMGGNMQYGPAQHDAP